MINKFSNSAETLALSIKWAVWVYSFTDSFPKESTPLRGAAAMSKQPKPFNPGNSSEEIKASEKFLTPDKVPVEDSESIIILGITSIRINRSKGSVSGTCVFTMQGPMPENIFIGAWIMAKSYNSAETALDVGGIARFIGQIVDVETNYSFRSDGSFLTTSKVVVKEWSSFLDMPVRYDLYSLQHSFLKTPFGIEQLAGSLLSGDKTYETFVRGTYDSLQLAQLLLKLTNAINNDDSIVSIKSTVKDINFPSVAVTTPDVPKSLINRIKVELGGLANLKSLASKFSSPLGTPESSNFSSFVHVFTGALTKKPEIGNGWKGIFEEEYNIGDLKEDMMKGYESSVRPSISGIGALAQIGSPVWSLIRSFCEPEVNDFYTDLIYQRTPNGVVAVPSIILRDKPFLLKQNAKVLELKYQMPISGQDLSYFTKYDDLPRIQINTAAVTDFALNNSQSNSPNYIRIDFNAYGVDSRITEASSALDGFVRLTPEMKRFGGMDGSLSCNFMGLSDPKGIETADNKNDKANFFAAYFNVLKALAEGWFADSYKTGTGTLVLKDSNQPFTLGMNAQFTFGNIDLVGHIESISIDYSIDPSNGLGTGNVSLELSRIVEDRGIMLDYLDITKISKIYKSGKPKINNTFTDVPIPKIPGVSIT